MTNLTEWSKRLQPGTISKIEIKLIGEKKQYDLSSFITKYFYWNNLLTPIQLATIYNFIRLCLK